jgi:transcriptional regulator with XRE-family HTH domain
MGTEVGALIRDWRRQRRLSQLSLALETGVSSRHLSFVETGRSRPSADLLLALAEFLELPLRERNRLLLAGGYAPRYRETPLSSPAVAPVLAGLARLLELHEPYPGVVLDRQWNVVRANAAAERMLALLPPALREPPVNLFRASLRPDGLAAMTTNFAAWGAYLVDELERLADRSGDPALAALHDEVLAYGNVAALRRRRASSREEPPTLLVPCELALGRARLSLFTTLARIGTARDVTLAELTTELFYPADAESAATLRALATA